MDRRGFLKIFGKAAAGAAIVYSFPSIIIPKNIIIPYEIGLDVGNGLDISALNIITKNEIYPELIRDIWFVESPFFARIKNKYGMSTHQLVDRIYQ